MFIIIGVAVGGFNYALSYGTTSSPSRFPLAQRLMLTALPLPSLFASSARFVSLSLSIAAPIIQFDANLFLTALLPIIIFEAGYSVDKVRRRHAGRPRRATAPGKSLPREDAARSPVDL